MVQLIAPSNGSMATIQARAVDPGTTFLRRDEKDERSRRPVQGIDECAEIFRMHGGVHVGNELAAYLRTWIDQPVSHLGRLIASRRVLSLCQGPRILIPLFQFSRALAVRPEVEAVIAELVEVLDDRELACWFATGNGWLGGARPVGTIDADPGAVHAAARADRFVVRGG